MKVEMARWWSAVVLETVIGVWNMTQVMWTGNSSGTVEKKKREKVGGPLTVAMGRRKLML